MMATYFELTSLAHVKFPPRKPYIVATFTVCVVKCEDNGERILYVDGQERSIVKQEMFEEVRCNSTTLNLSTSIVHTTFPLRICL